MGLAKQTTFLNPLPQVVMDRCSLLMLEARLLGMRTTNNSFDMHITMGNKLHVIIMVLGLLLKGPRIHTVKILLGFRHPLRHLNLQLHNMALNQLLLPQHLRESPIVHLCLLGERRAFERFQTCLLG